ncbi:RAD50 [[Candida] subhashii]|uniref:DNA repair protein RAD50 n=1 Tax=[Candida] subhashii TaxID=561895 RepID=A0A8J5QXT0_9ASCO|nr:RAD50 [[Candida] subhashii]KAG7664165.1 RAD50 [[Candida] subhashii]
MSSLYKLSIKGIRAFEPETEETIQFGFPLTLICGQNGCGKTTVIECLKYATTGDLPPNSKGGAFVHDPSLSGRSTVTGQIKLAFRNVNGKSMITTRSVQLSKKQGRGGAASLTFKTLEGQLALIDKGEKVSISTKNAELDGQTPIYLGASRAILDYVIFCHQDESLWPMSEASLLKKRFDDIFEASKFTKVLDNLKSIKKEMATDIKLIEQSVRHLKIDKDRAQKVQDKLKAMNESVDRFNEEILDLNIKIEKKEKEADNLFASNQEFQRTLSDYENLVIKRKSLEEQIERMKSNLTILSDSDEELMHKQQNFSNITAEKKDKIEELQMEQDELNEELKSKTNEYNELIRIDGSLKSKKAQYDKNLGEISTIIQNNSTAFDVQLSDDISSNITTFKKAIERKHKKVLGDQKKLLTENKSKESEKQSLVQEMLNSLSREEQHREYISNDLTAANLKLNSLRRQLESRDNDESELDSKKLELETTSKKLDEKKNSNEIKDLDLKIDEGNYEISKLEFELDELAKKLSMSNKQSDLRSKITYLQDSLSSRKESVNKLIASIGGDYEKLVGTKLDGDSTDIQLNDKIRSLEEKFEEKQSKVISLKGEVETNKSLMEASKKSKEVNLSKMQDLKANITKVIEEDEISTYEEVVEDLEESYGNVMEDVSTSEVTKQFNITAVSIAEKNQHCLLCKRSFEGDSLQKFINELKQSVDEKKIKEINDQAQEIKQELDGVKAINTDILNYRECVGQAAEIGKRIQDLELQLGSLSVDLQKEVSELETIKSSLDQAILLRKPLTELMRLNAEISDLRKQIADLSDELNDFGSAILSISELQGLQQEKNNKIKEARQDVTKFTESKYVVQREIQRLESKVKDVQLQISNLEKSLSEVTNIKNSILEIERSSEKNQGKMESIDASVKELEIEKEKRIKSLHEAQEKIRKSELEMETEVESISQLFNSYTSLHEVITDFETTGVSALEENNTRMEEVSNILEDLNKRIQVIVQDIKALEKEVFDASAIERNIIVNIDYRVQLNKLDETDFQLNSMDIENAQTKKEEYQEMSKRLRQEISDLTSRHAGKTGEVKQIRDQIKGLQKELETEYKNVNQTYHEEWIKLQTNMLVSNDIQNYSKALDNAIMKYHSLKMEDINRILGELWSQTYKGSDISTIAIKSDVNLQAKGNRSYNYRVVMVKNASELDMRGRCSAGQKVLASILIRLALAECFGANCGMIALDEPTTNLDSENSEALAEALNHIIEYRKEQSNFQLIVITHDEKFLTHIKGDRFTDHFYRIQRDESNKSRIYSLPIGRIQEA